MLSVALFFILICLQISIVTKILWSFCHIAGEIYQAYIAISETEIISHLRETQIYRKKPASLVMRQVLIYCDFYIREIFMYAFIVELSAAIFEL